MSKQRSLLLFENSIKSEATREKYLYYLSKFKDFYKLRDYDNVIQIPQDKLQIMVEDYVMDLKKRVNPNTVPTPMYAIQSFLEASDIELKWKKIKKLYPAKIKKSGGKAWLTAEVQRMLRHTSELRTIIIIHFLAASGMRIGGMPDLQIRHLTRIENCYAVLVYENSTEEYTTFLTPEATNLLDEYLDKRRKDGEYLGPNSPLFRTKYQLGITKAHPMSQGAIEAVVRNLIHKSGLRINKKGNRYDQQADHGFRKRWNTIVKTTDGVKIIMAEKMFAHSTPTIRTDETYLDPSIEKLFKEYRKAIPELTIDDSERIRVKNERLRKENTEYKNGISSLEQKVLTGQEQIDNAINLIETLQKKFEESLQSDTKSKTPIDPSLARVGED